MNSCSACAVDLLVDRHQRERDREIECRPRLAHVGGREIDEQPSRRIGEAGVEDRRAHALARFAERAIGQPDDRKARRARRAVGFDAHDVAFDAEHRGREGEREHRRPLRVRAAVRLGVRLLGPARMRSRERGVWSSRRRVGATLGVVICGSVVAAASSNCATSRRGNQLQALLSLERDFRAPELQAALTYVQEQLPERLEDQISPRARAARFHRSGDHPGDDRLQLAQRDGHARQARPVSEDTFMDLFARLIVHCWKQVSPAIAIMRRNRGQAQYHDFEYLAMRAAAWLKRNPHGMLPRTFDRRGPLPDPWREIDQSEAGSRISPQIAQD